MKTMVVASVLALTAMAWTSQAMAQFVCGGGWCCKPSGALHQMECVANGRASKMAVSETEACKAKCAGEKTPSAAVSCLDQACPAKK